MIEWLLGMCDAAAVIGVGIVVCGGSEAVICEFIDEASNGIGCDNIFGIMTLLDKCGFL